ncbi:MAG TPA: alpha/beta hydrolase [Leptospiraceae bacterium]|nr:alpha/beta hydrolase [Leptospiraceae bacterium]HMW07472.1 alpha/beta hydrolase [Leptospiraceae bacterium]HMX34909.1 alpha/beta hydrolase [Leptospiraceae bacterium]HMY33134.1 alpha/beta hydrolase [Leptospiraceae bacterium]HMZ67360.1 alpha/beta hydrolase [Leptospiraceae bacterium]
MPTFYETVSSIGHKISVKRTINQKKDTMVLLHGFNDNKETFGFLEEFLSKRFNLISFDFRGHGDSDWKKDSLYNYSENLIDVNNVLEHYCKEPIVLLGHSMGAGMAARFTGLFPEKVKLLICLEGFSGLQPQEVERNRLREWLTNISRRNERHTNSAGERKKNMTLEEAKSKLSFIYGKLAKEKIDILINGLVRETEDGSFKWKNDPNLKTSSPIPFPPELSRKLWSEIICPVLIFFGRQTHIRPKNLEEILSHFKNVELHEIEHAGHNMHHDRPEVLIEIMDKFFIQNGFESIP